MDTNKTVSVETPAKDIVAVTGSPLVMWEKATIKSDQDDTKALPIYLDSFDIFLTSVWC